MSLSKLLHTVLQVLLLYNTAAQPQWIGLKAVYFTSMHDPYLVKSYIPEAVGCKINFFKECSTLLLTWNFISAKQVQYFIVQQTRY